MKKLLLIVGAMLMVSSAHASKARMEALHQGKMGSDFLTDTRSVFSNPAAINDLGQYLILEWGQRNGAAATGVDTQVAPKPEGGFFVKHNDLNWGVYLGNEEDAITAARLGANAAFAVPDNAFEVFFGSQAAVKWGASFFYSNTQNDLSATVSQKQNLMGIRGGVVADQFEVGLTYGIADTAKGITGNADAEWKGKSEMALYALYHAGVGDAYLGYVNAAGDYTANATATVVTNKTNDTYVGWAKQFAVKERGFWFYDLNYRMSVLSDDGTTKVTYNHIPVTFGYEGKANSWLTLRGSVQQDLLINEVKTGDLKTTNANTTTVAAGATIGFDTTKVDFVVGDMATGTFHTGNNTAAANQANGMFSRVSMTYNF